MASKLINDPIYGAVNIDEDILPFINTPEFQRLHHIKQLSFCFHVYPGASHTRFEHSIGTMHLVGELIKKLKEVELVEPKERLDSPEAKKSKIFDAPEAKESDIINAPEAKESKIFDDKDILCVKLAALLHDLGHGPFSHFWEIMLKRFIEEKKHEAREEKFSKENFVHEEMTIKLIERMRKNNSKIKELLKDDDDVKFIQELIDPERRKDPEKESTRSREPLKNFYYEIVSNKDNEIDLDKWDYIARDSHHVGINTCFETDRLMKTCHVGIDEDGKTHIVWTLKDLDNLALVFEQRKRLHRKVYQHINAIQAAKLYEEVFEAAADLEILSSVGDGKKKPLLKAHEDLDVFLNLNDGVLNFIQNKLFASHRANQQLRKIQKQDFSNYKFIGDVRLMSDNLEILKDEAKKVKEELETNLKVNLTGGTDIKVYRIDLDFTKKEVNPLNDVYLHNEGKKRAEKASIRAKQLVDQYSPARRFEKNFKAYYIIPDDGQFDSKILDSLKENFSDTCKKLKEENFKGYYIIPDDGQLDWEILDSLKENFSDTCKKFKKSPYVEIFYQV